MSKPTQETLMVDVFVRHPLSQGLEKRITWYAKLSNAHAWTVIEKMRAVLREADAAGFYQHDVTTDQEIAHWSVIDGVTPIRR